jgi:hypothetical protein
MTEWLNAMLFHSGPIGEGIETRRPTPPRGPILEISFSLTVALNGLSETGANRFFSTSAFYERLIVNVPSEADFCPKAGFVGGDP